MGGGKQRASGANHASLSNDSPSSVTGDDTGTDSSNGLSEAVENRVRGGTQVPGTIPATRVVTRLSPGGAGLYTRGDPGLKNESPQGKYGMGGDRRR